MYNINTKTDKPDVGAMEATVQSLMKRGIRLGHCVALRDHYTNERDYLKKELHDKYGISNPNSSKQITYFLEGLASQVDLQDRNDIVNVCYDSSTGKWTSNKDALGVLADLGYEFAKDLLNYRHAKKFAESIQSLLDASDENGLIHPKVSLGKTHRVNYSDPGILTIPKKLLWNLIGPYSDNGSLWSVDIKNQEPSILINMTNAEELKPALESPDGLYEYMFKQCFIPKVTANVLVDTLPENRRYTKEELKAIGTISPAKYSAVRPDVEDVNYHGVKVELIETVCIGSEKGIEPDLPDTVKVYLVNGDMVELPVQWDSYLKKYKRASDYSVDGTIDGLDVQISKVARKEFKTAWNAISYGATIFGVKLMCKNIDGSRVYNFCTKINGLKNYREKVKEVAKKGIEQGYACIGTVFGTPLNTGYEEDFKRLNRVLLDIPVQGTGADILSLLIKRFYSYSKEHGIEDKLSLYFTRHDELIIEVDKAWENSVGVQKVEDILRDMLEHRIDNWTPFKVEVTQLKPGSLADEDIVDEEDE